MLLFHFYFFEEECWSELKYNFVLRFMVTSKSAHVKFPKMLILLFFLHLLGDEQTLGYSVGHDRTSCIQSDITALFDVLVMHCITIELCDVTVELGISLENNENILKNIARKALWVGLFIKLCTTLGPRL